MKEYIHEPCNGCQVYGESALRKKVAALVSQIAELTAERDRFRKRCEELEARLDLGTGNMYDVVCAENEKLREAIARANAANMSEDECISKLLDDFQVTITITPKTLPDNQEDDCEPDD